MKQENNLIPIKSIKGAGIKPCFSLDMIIQKLTANEGQNIVKDEEQELLAFLNGKEHKTIGDRGHKIRIYRTRYGRIVDFGEEREPFERFALPGNTLTLYNGREITLEDFLKEEYNRDINGEEVQTDKGEESGKNDEWAFEIA